MGEVHTYEHKSASKWWALKSDNITCIYILLLYVYCMYIYIYTLYGTCYDLRLIPHLGCHPQLCFGSTAYHNKTLKQLYTFCWRAMEWRKSSWRSLLFFTSNPNPSNHLLLSLFLVLPGRWIVVWQPSRRLYFLNPSGLTTKKDRFQKKSSLPSKRNDEAAVHCTFLVYRYILRIYIYFKIKNIIK